MSARRLSSVLLLILLLATANLSQTVRHRLTLDDIARLREVRDPQVSPDGQWVAFVVAAVDAKDDKTSSHVWMVGYDGRNERQITFSQDSESAAVHGSGWYSVPFSDRTAYSRLRPEPSWLLR